MIIASSDGTDGLRRLTSVFEDISTKMNVLLTDAVVTLSRGDH